MLDGDGIFTRAARGTIAGAAVFACVGLMSVGTRPELAPGWISEIARAPGSAATAAKSGAVNPIVAAPLRGEPRTK